MNTMYKIIEELCKGKGVSITKMCKEAGVARAPLTELKMGRTQKLSVENAEKIASYFGVTVSYLLGTETKKAPSETDGVEFDDFTYAAHNYSGKLTDADKETIKKMMAMLAAANQEEEADEQTGGDLSGVDG